MTSDARKQFARSLRSLDRAAFVAFVLALWTAREWEATASGTAIEAYREGRKTQILRVVVGIAGWLAVGRLILRPAAVDVVVTRGRLTGAAVDGVYRFRRQSAFDHVSPDDLYARYQYGLDDDDRRRLREYHLGVDLENPTAVDRLHPALDRTPRLGDALDRTITARSARTVFVGAILVALVLIGAVFGPLAGVPLGEQLVSTDSDVAHPTPLSVNTVTATTPPTTARSAAIPPVCPSPPTAVHPAVIRPGVIRTASTSGLEGWTIRLEETLTDFDPNDESRRTVPEIRYLVVYETPSGAQYRLVIDRWASVERAAESTTRVERRGEREPLVWGAYSIAVEPYTTEISDRTTVDVRVLLENVQTPDGITLGSRCVDALSGDDQAPNESDSIRTTAS